MDFPQQPQGATPFPAAPQPSTPPPFPNVGNPSPAPMPAGPMPGATMPPLGTVAEPTPVQIPVQSHAAAGMSMSGGEDQVYTMPDKFLAGNTPLQVRTKKPSKAITVVLIVVIILMILGAVGGVLYYFLVLGNQQTTEIDAQNAVVVNNANSTNTNNSNVANTNSTNVNNANTSNTNGNGFINTNENANVNENANTNANVNAVANDNTNTATDVNANSNDNTNVNSNTNTNANDNTNTAVVPAPGKDSDADALTNDEEAIWSTKAELPDTDGDGYTDGAEILAGYDPTNATSAGRLAASALVSTFTNSKYAYSMLYPKNWLAEGLSEVDSTEVVITPNTVDLAGQFVVVTITANPTGLSALDWYSNTVNVDESELESVTSFDGATGVWSADRATAYYADANYVYAISYSYGSSNELRFPTSFEMMVKSFSLETE